MKLLHVSDWHLGRTLYNEPRAPDHDKVLGEIIDIARQSRPHLIVHTGDLFESVRPGYEDMDRAVNALMSLSDVAPVVVLAGNHDSPALFRLFGKLLHGRSNIRLVDRARAPGEGGVLHFPGPRGHTIRLAVLPFVHAHRAVDAFDTPEVWMMAYADRIRAICDALWEGLQEDHNPTKDILLFAAHLHVEGAMFSSSERQIHVTESYATRAGHVPPVSYAAFGHIHRPQALPGTTRGRFAGSPIPLDFGEMSEKKGVVLVEVAPGKPADVEVIPLSGGRPLKRIEGTLESIASRAEEAKGALCLVTVLTEKPIVDLSNQLRDLLPGATLLQVLESCRANEVVAVVAPEEQAAEPGFDVLFQELLKETPTKMASAADVYDTFRILLRSVEGEQAVTFAEEVIS